MRTEMIERKGRRMREDRDRTSTQVIGVNGVSARLVLAGLIIVAAFTSSAPSARAAAYPDFVGCNPELPALAMVANLHHVTMRTACRLTFAIEKHAPPNPPLSPDGPPCVNPFAHMHRFRGWRVRILNRGYGIMRRGRANFAFQYQDGPLACI
jgi:hypothetical protein